MRKVEVENSIIKKYNNFPLFVKQLQVLSLIVKFLCGRKFMND